MGLSTSVLLTIALAPLFGSLVAGFVSPFLGRAGRAVAHSVTIACMIVSVALSFQVLYQLTLGGAENYNQNIYTWFQVGQVNASIGFMVDRLTAMMLVVVGFVSLVVHLYTIGYMRDDSGYTRFFSYISLFTFSMFMLVMSNNFLQLFFGWEAVGLVSYLLIGFWYKRPTAIFANLKAFLVNRVGDFGFLLGIAAVLTFLHTLDYASAFSAAPGLAGQVLQITANMQWDAATVICILLFVGAMGKSAQVPLHVWLPDSMEGPTPISALIHAATMVTAGIFMVARMSPLFEMSSTALSFVLVIGATTALFTGLIGIVQNDIKRVIAYSTLSQLGYMTVALGVSMYSGAVFHLMTHAFFKALLFLGAGSVIIAMHHEQDMRYMGGLRKYMPITWITMWIGSLALVAGPFTSGFYSKDAIIEAVGLSHRWGANYAYFCVMAGVLVTGLYTFRQMYLTFHGKERFTVVAAHGDDHETASSDVVYDVHVSADSHEDEHHSGGQPGVLHHPPKESPWVVTVPLILLAIPSLLIGYVTVGPMLFGNWFGGAIHVNEANDVLAELGQEFHGAAAMALHGFTQLPFVLVVVAFVICTYIYVFNPALADRIKRALKPLWTVLDRKYWVDEVEYALFASGGQKMGRLFWKFSDAGVIDGVAVNGSVRLIHRSAALMRRLQTGYLYHYAFAMIIGVIVLFGGYRLFGN
ncbi:NADH-quinone oxidoreductase subunit L [Rhodanobacter thiooxydans]|uniref:NADH-quinone oxidoreductase subunit L n=1 Tax=Rhodanobacter thiooxydans TaxID=416169 RepID=A0A154QGY1_9GAMM|nr:NADH-quinone oxidoreductase subunit L [Rhodanobacter thiooxydans]EIL99942.1 proton-translocating NADH-quinone oxidoreductase subunit L [Rhodanobacter thiooxydans LCS2]KZC23533.1 NADH-quinone oxidoreductase subunit L [Rhodanobacter thiooxydans]MCW0200575.1 NADH-quinone oxidoreductase subunit L [Rhodanobacter thiooxydans]